MTNTYSRVLRRFGLWSVRRRLVPLSAALLVGLASLMPRQHPAVGMLLLSQFGLVLLWQPVYRPDGAVGRRGVLGAMLIGMVLILLGSIALPFWIALLAALAADRAAAGHGQWSRRFHLGLLLWLLGALWMRALPTLVGIAPPFPDELVPLFAMGLMLLAVLPSDPRHGLRMPRQDVLFSMLTLVLGLLIGLAALLLEALHIAGYVAGLAAALIGAGAILGLMAWLWNPRGDFVGLGAMLSAQLLHLGTPFERWSGRLAEFSEREDSPHDFLAVACGALLGLPPVVGGEWVSDDGAGRFGAHAQYGASFRVEGLVLQLYTPSPMPLILYSQFQLVTALLRQFLRAKEHEQRLADYVYVEAVHQTGARLTHDIKNLLQALKTLIGAADVSTDPEGLLALYTRQLPAVVRRLEETLSRLRTPAEAEVALRPAAEWWQAAQMRWSTAGLSFAMQTADNSPLDASLFDPVLDNLIQNAVDKRAAKLAAGAFPIRVELYGTVGGYVLVVEDEGDPVPTFIVADLFRRPVASRNGYGLGLYQLARLAASREYVLSLPINEAGCVRFELGPALR